MESQFHDNKVFEDIVFAGGAAKGREFEKCTFKNCNLSGSDFSQSVFSECVFIGCNLAGIKLRDTSVKDVIFKNCKVLGVNFSQCADFLFSVGFEKSVLNYAAFTGKKMSKTKFLQCSLKDSDFSGTDLTHAVFDNCDLQGAVFNKAILKSTDFTTSYSYMLDPELNMMKGAKFSLDGLPGLLTKYDIEIM